MRLKSVNISLMKFLVLALLFYLTVAGSFSLFATIYPIITLVLIIHMWISKNGWRNKILLCMIYIIIMVVQLIFTVFIVFSGDQASILFELKKFVSVCLILAPFSFNSDSLAEIAKDIPRHSYTKYLNRNTLTEAYFKECEASLEDEHLYIVISSTGSSSSELISVFTRKEYNHVSLSFDRDLRTILSYNGGENVSPPGLNREQLDYFNRKVDASMLVYSLKAPKEKKQLVLDKIKEINEKGSAYNLVGLVTKVSVRPNIMFCSQFVYSILRYAELIFFTEKAASVRPSDFIERDYYRKLKFCYEIKFNG